MIIEAQAHLSLKEFLKQNSNISTWQHHLTMTRLVARALRLGRSSLIQTGVPLGDVNIPYRLSYLTPALLWDEPVILVGDDSIQNHLFYEKITDLQQSLKTKKIVTIIDNYSHNWQGLLLTSLEFWLNEKLNQTGFFPPGITTIIDGADQLEDLTREQLTVSLTPQNWDELMFSFPQEKQMILDTKVKLTKIVFSHPSNPYNCYLLDNIEKQILSTLLDLLPKLKNNESQNIITSENHSQSLNQINKLPNQWQIFQKQWAKENSIKWVSINRVTGQFSLYCGELEVGTKLSKIWTEQPIVLIGTLLDKSPDAHFYRQQLGLPDLTCLQFSIDRQTEPIRLYIPDHIPMPN
ncbi:MAG TPA: ATP-dependent DNA helicase, partial [Allocoleopsis sp.]